MELLICHFNNYTQRCTVEVLYIVEYNYYLVAISINYIPLRNFTF